MTWEFGDSGRYDVSDEEVDGLVRGMVTAMEIGPDAVARFAAETFPEIRPEDVPSAHRLQGRMVGRLVAVIALLRKLGPGMKTHIDGLLS